MEERKCIGYTPDYIDSLPSGHVFVFGSNVLGYHTGGASGTARKKFGAVWGQAEGVQGQSYAIPVDFGKDARKDSEVKAAVERFITFAKEHTELFFWVTRVGCGIAGYHDDEMAQFFKDALGMKNVCLPKSFVDALNGCGVKYDLERFLKAQEIVYPLALKEIKEGSQEEAKAYLEHPVLGARLREITQALLDCGNPSADDILGFPDVLKVRSCMTLFDLVSPNDIFNKVLFRFYESQKCDKTLWRLGFHETKLKNQVKLSKLTITKDYAIILSDYDNKEVKMEPLVKAVYLLFLKHPEGIAFKQLPDYRQELIDIYNDLRPLGLNKRSLQSIEDVTNPLLNSINEKCARIRAAFVDKFDEHLAKNYFITGERGEAKKIILPQDLVVWE